MFEFDQNIKLLPLNFHYSILLSIHDFFSLIERIIVYERRARKKEDFFWHFFKAKRSYQQRSRGRTL